jgi:hypothetical protein
MRASKVKFVIVMVLIALLLSVLPVGAQEGGFKLTILHNNRWHTLGRARFRGRCASRRHSPRHADVSVSWRDRPDRYRSGYWSEASAPGSDASCRKRCAGRGADTPAIFIVRVGTVSTGTAPGISRPLASCYGSDLLSPRMLWHLQRGDVFFHAAPRGVYRTLPRSVGSARSWFRCAPRSCYEWGLLAGSSRREPRLRPGLRSSNHYPQG